MHRTITQLTKKVHADSGGVKKNKQKKREYPGFIRNTLFNSERKTRLELATLTLARLCSTN